MSEATTLWIFGTIVSVLLLATGTLGKLLWEHVQHCKDVASKLAEIGSDVKRIKEDIGNHDSGIRKDIRDHTREIFKHDARIENIERRAEAG